MEKKLSFITFGILSLTALIFLISSCGITPPQTPDTIPDTSIMNILKIEPTSPYHVEITNLSTQTHLSIYREFLFKKEKISDLKPGETFVDVVPWDGSEYKYIAYIKNTSYFCSKSIVTPVSEETKQRGLFFDWNNLANQYNVPREIYEIKPGSKIYVTHLHGVKLTIAFEPGVATYLTDILMDAFFKEAIIDFHRHWLLYEGFPVNEYKIIAIEKDEMPAYSENLLGNHIPKSFLLQTIEMALEHNHEAISHGIGHAWMADAISTDNISDGWIYEGFDHFNGIITLSGRIKFLNDDIAYLRHSKYSNEPLYQMYEKFFGTDHAYVYYAKGSILAYLISRKLSIETGKTYKDFMKYLYDKYFLSENKPGNTLEEDNIRINSTKLLSDLNEFSGIDFSDLFNKYVFGTSDITEGLYIEEKYLPEWDY